MRGDLLTIADGRHAAPTPTEARITAERIDRAITTVAAMMVKHDMPQLMTTIRRLEAERDKLRHETSALDYAKEILRQRAQHGKQHDGSLHHLSY